jgi:putative alpha-1,2-mannosidase
MFSTSAIHLGDGRKLSIRSTGSGAYVQQVVFDGKENNDSWLPLSALHPGSSTLEFTLSPEPNTQRGLPSSERRLHGRDEISELRGATAASGDAIP